MVELDLNEVLQDMHADLLTVDQVTGQCDCGEYVGQNQHLCPYCKEPISWKHSKLWTRTFLEGEGNDFARYFLEKVKLSKFKDGKEYHRWRLVSLALGEEATFDAVDYCRNGLRKRDGKATGRAVMQYTLRVLERKLKKEPSVKEGEIIGRVGDPD